MRISAINVLSTLNKTLQTYIDSIASHQKLHNATITNQSNIPESQINDKPSEDITNNSKNLPIFKNFNNGLFSVTHASRAQGLDDTGYKRSSGPPPCCIIL